jgi:hypothetical protein
MQGEPGSLQQIYIYTIRVEALTPMGGASWTRRIILKIIGWSKRAPCMWLVEKARICDEY